MNSFNVEKENRIITWRLADLIKNTNAAALWKAGLWHKIMETDAMFSLQPKHEQFSDPHSDYKYL